MDRSDRLLPVKEVAKKFGVSRYTVYIWLNKKFLEKVELASGSIRVTESSVNKMLAEGLARGKELKESKESVG